MRLTALLLISCLFAIAGEARAQNDTAQAQHAQLLLRLPPGTKLRVQSGSARQAGALQNVTADSLYLDDRGLALRDVQRVWVRQRATRKGAKLGAIIGVPAGAAFGAFIVWIADALCESSCGSLSAGEVILGTLGFGAFGGVAGGTVGAVIGAGIPRWVDLTDERLRLPELAADARANPTIGSVAVTPVYARFSSSDEAGMGARGAYTFQTPHIGLGLEAGRYSPGTTDRLRFLTCPGGSDLCADTVAVNTYVFHVGGIARIGIGSAKRIEPYATLGIGLYSWNYDESGGSVALGGYLLGGGVVLRDRSAKRGVFADARWQSNLTRSGDPTPQFGFYTLGLGVMLAW